MWGRWTLLDFGELFFAVVYGFGSLCCCSHFAFKRRLSLLPSVPHSKCGYDEAKEKTNENVLGEEKEHQLDGLKCAKEFNRLLHLGFIHAHLLVSCTKRVYRIAHHGDERL